MTSEKITRGRNELNWLGWALLNNGELVDTGEWQSLRQEGMPQHKTLEMMNVTVGVEIPETVEELQVLVEPNLPFAEEQFKDRVSGEPLNPPPSHKLWPWYRHNAQHQGIEPGFPYIDSCDWIYLAGLIDGEGCLYFRRDKWLLVVSQHNPTFNNQMLQRFKVGYACDHDWRVSAQIELLWVLEHITPYLVIKQAKAEEALQHTRRNVEVKRQSKGLPCPDQEGRFSHTYPERFWPPGGTGIRYPFGNLGDVVDLLARSPYTRQAILPVWSMEDTGSVHGERVPCSIVYHFLLREGRLNVTYFIRSCDFLRHFRDDVYMAARLCQWVLGEVIEGTAAQDPDSPWTDVIPGTLTMHMTSLHVFEGDLPKMRREYDSSS